MYYLRARYYQPGSGRFWTRDTWALDPQNPREWNRYVYVAADPVNGVDPSGLLMGEQAHLNQQSSTESEGAALAGDSTADVVATDVADFNALGARGTYNSQLLDLPAKQRQLTIVETQVTVNGERQTIITVNDFPTQKTYNLSREAVRRIEQFANDVGWKFRGGNLGVKHAEDHAIEVAKEIGLKSGDRLSLGVSNPVGPCEICVVRQEREIEGGIHIITRYIDKVGLFAGH